MHLLTVDEKGLADGFIEAFPQSVYVVADVAGAQGVRLAAWSRQQTAGMSPLDGHEAGAGKDGHDGEKVPKRLRAKKLQAADIYPVRPVYINAARHNVLGRRQGRRHQRRRLIHVCLRLTGVP